MGVVAGMGLSLPKWRSDAGSPWPGQGAVPTVRQLRQPMAQAVPRSPQPLRSTLASLLGIGIGLLLTGFLPVVPSTLLNALVLVGGAQISHRCRQSSRWWALIGCATGSLIGNGWVLAGALQETHPSAHVGGRLATVLLLCAAGAAAGQSLSRLSPAVAHRQPRDLLRAASGLTTGVFAALVTLTFVHSGLDVARTFSSRLSTSLTILVVCLAAPGWLGHLIRQQLQAGKAFPHRPFDDANDQHPDRPPLNRP
jgi:hypothetical protein